MFKNLINNIKGDKYIWYIAAILAVFSMLLVYSSARTLAYKSMHGSTEILLVKHLMNLGIGFGVIYLVHRVDHRYFSRIAQLMLILSIFLLAYTLVFGISTNDATRWVKIPVIGLRFQSSDIARLALIMYTSRTISKMQGVIKDFKEVSIYLMGPIVLICALIMLENLSTAAILFMTCIVILFIGRVSTKYILFIFGGGLLVGGMLFALSFFKIVDFGRADTWVGRVDSWLHPDYSSDDLFQQKQANIAMAKGGFFRIAPGKSTQCNFLPEAYSDYIFSTLVEEYGLVGAIFILCLYLFFLYRIVVLYNKSTKAFGALIAVGLGISITMQAVMHMAVNTHLLPNTGITLPLISWGGTSIVANSIALGIILSVSAYVEKAPATNSEVGLVKKRSPKKKDIVNDIHG
ncbi:MAG TPA: FtsW/RodA/SpoVE family cell cycle protein [Chitinophagales bacterium]|nr:FtsW/RodA/SpoVE family cell cycle protein [Chitinophagales bacterium]HNC63175.1 FtsW/RodA/SpoVE family cell cycle protein [Chitinophagales bacterium]HNG26952.1 FtsW/RodA/SpoVE family cell cycle protein [Chitinophagales bacterium]HNI00875.1 FtsW/RodA/SpoVE family cell cycle protein [Chitinophagales bacterium]